MRQRSLTYFGIAEPFVKKVVAATVDTQLTLVTRYTASCSGRYPGHWRPRINKVTYFHIQSRWAASD